MRRYARPLVLIAILVALAAVILSIQQIRIGDFERGSDTLLGLSLGLDLQGGSHLVYRAVDTETRLPISPTADEMEALKRSIERRVNSSGLGEPIIQVLGDDQLLIQLPGVRDPDRAKSIIGETAQLVYKRRSLNVPRDLDDIEVVSVSAGTLPLEGEESVEPSATADPEVTTESADPSAATASETGEPTAEGEPQPEEEVPSPPVLIVEFTEVGAGMFAEVVAGLEESVDEVVRTEAFRLPSRLDISVEGAEPLRYEVAVRQVVQIGDGPVIPLPGDPLIRRIDDGNSFSFPFPPSPLGEIVGDLESAQALLGDSPTIHLTVIQSKVDEDIDLTGDDLANAYSSQDQTSGAPIVAIEFDSRGTRIFGELTEQIVLKQRQTGQRDQIAIFLDNEELISPVVETPITAGTAIIRGSDFTVERVRDLALLLESGRLPVTIELQQERDVDAILGADSLSRSLVAGSVGLALVLVFMVMYYRVPGLVAAGALIVYASLILAIFKIVGVTLTLSGIAAAILSIGMAVDANILIFERMKDELRAGRTLLSAINIGFDRAWPAIRDSNVSTLITCGILYYFSAQLGETRVQGFAVVLAIGVGVSMFSAITVSRTFLRVIATTGMARRLGVFVPTGGADLPQLSQPAPAPQRS